MYFKPLYSPRSTDLQVEVSGVQEVFVENIRVLVNRPQKDFHLVEIHNHPVRRKHVAHQVFKHDESLHQKVLVARQQKNMDSCCLEHAWGTHRGKHRLDADQQMTFVLRTDTTKQEKQMLI